MSNVIEVEYGSRKACSVIKNLSYKEVSLSDAIEVSVYVHFLLNNISKHRIPLKEYFVNNPIFKMFYYAWNTKKYAGQINGKRIDVLFDLMAHERMVKMVYPLAERFGERSMVISGRNLSVQKSGYFSVISHDEIQIDAMKWINSVTRAYPQWRSSAKTMCEEAGVHPSHSVRIESLLVHASLAIERLTALWEAVKPKLVVVINDHYIHGAILCALARKYSVPSITMQHGVLDRTGLYLTVPLLAGHYFAWGEYDAQFVRESGTPESSIHLVGCPTLQYPPAHVESEVIQKKKEFLGNYKNRFIAVLAVNIALEPSALIKMFEKLSMALKKAPDWIGVVRPHPSQTKKEITKLLRRYSDIYVIDNGLLSVTETAQFADAVITHQTSFAMDALVSGATIIGFDIFETSMGYVEDLYRKFHVAYKASDENELAECLLSIQNRDARYQEIQKNRPEVLPHFFARFGAGAQEAAYQELEKIMKN